MNETIQETEARLESCGFKREIAGGDFEKAANAVNKANAESRGIVINGRSGSGKTFLSVCAFKDAAVISCKDGSIPSYGETLCDSNIVIIDDLGLEPVTNTFGDRSEPFVKFIADWYESPYRCRLIVTTNMTTDEMFKRYGERTLSRLFACCERVHFDGSDHRHGESCYRGESRTVSKLLREFSRTVERCGVENVYPETFIRKESIGLSSIGEREAFASGVRNIMGGHPGCKVDPDSGPSLSEMFRNAIEKIRKARNEL